MPRAFDRAIADGVIKKFILIAVDMNTPLGTSWYVNSPTTGNWEDFMIQELVPYIDANFKTIPSRDSRSIAGIFIGGYGAIRFGMRHPDVFGTVYAMHPVGTGTGVGLSAAIPKWNLLANAKNMDDVKKDAGTRIFTTMFQAHLPNVDKPPLFIDLLARDEDGQLSIDARLMDSFRNNFYLETMIPQSWTGGMSKTETGVALFHGNRLFTASFSAFANMRIKSIAPRSLSSVATDSSSPECAIILRLRQDSQACASPKSRR